MHVLQYVVLALEALFAIGFLIAFFRFVDEMLEGHREESQPPRGHR